MSRQPKSCPDCEGRGMELDRRHFLAAAGAAVTVAALPRIVLADDKASDKPTPETLVKKLYETLTDEQKKSLLRLGPPRPEARPAPHARLQQLAHHAARDRGAFYTKDQQEICRAIYEGLFQPDWVKQIDKQLQDDNGGKAWGAARTSPSSASRATTSSNWS